MNTLYSRCFLIPLSVTVPLLCIDEVVEEGIEMPTEKEKKEEVEEISNFSWKEASFVMDDTEPIDLTLIYLLEYLS